MTSHRLCSPIAFSPCLWVVCTLPCLVVPLLQTSIPTMGMGSETFMTTDDCGNSATPAYISNLSNACTLLHMTKIPYKVLIVMTINRCQVREGYECLLHTLRGAVGLFSPEFHRVLARCDQLWVGGVFWPVRSLLLISSLTPVHYRQTGRARAGKRSGHSA